MTRIGVVEYRNTLPLAFGLETHVPGAAVTAGTPGAISDALEAGRLDVGLVPVVTAHAHPEWDWVPGLGIACDGPVDSVLVLARGTLPGAESLATDPASRTSNLLAQIVLEDLLKTPLEVVPGPAALRERLEAADAAVVIGDAALFFDDPGVERLDLGEAWKRSTGLPFVFAVWAGPRAADPALAEGLRRCYAANAGRLSDLARMAGGGDLRREAAVLDYLRHRVVYELTEAADRSMALFRERCSRLAAGAPTAAAGKAPHART
jgi:predicted solute-binding protein